MSWYGSFVESPDALLVFLNHCPLLSVSCIHAGPPEIKNHRLPRTWRLVSLAIQHWGFLLRTFNFALLNIRAWWRAGTVSDRNGASHRILASIMSFPCFIVC